MSFISLQFPLFFFSLLGLLSFARKNSMMWVALCGSFYFYGALHPELLVFLFWVIFISWFFASRIYRWGGNQKELLWLSLFLVFLPLLFLKSNHWTFLPSSLLLPVGISFFTFQAASYLMEIQRGTQNPVSLLSLSLYLSFFPQLVAGPIEKPGLLIPQLHKLKFPDQRALRDGIFEILCGLIKKCVLADRLALLVDPIFQSLPEFDLWTIAAATIFFGFQIYLDFSAYCHIAVGSARILGVRLSLNFDRPYLSKSPSEFWRRWHRTLGIWFRDYIYIPLGGARKNTSFALFCVFILSGIWHGRTALFVLWGLWHFILYILLEKSPWLRTFKERALPGWLLTQLGVFGGWFLFRTESPAALYTLMERAAPIDTILPFSWNQTSLVVATFICLSTLLFELSMEKFGLKKYFQNKSFWIGVMLLFCILLGRFEPYEFLYFQF